MSLGPKTDAGRFARDPFAVAASGSELAVFLWDKAYVAALLGPFILVLLSLPGYLGYVKF